MEQIHVQWEANTTLSCSTILFTMTHDVIAVTVCWALRTYIVLSVITKWALIFFFNTLATACNNEKIHGYFEQIQIPTQKHSPSSAYTWLPYMHAGNIRMITVAVSLVNTYEPN